MYGKHLLTIQNAKTQKGEALGFLTGILYLAPSTESVPFGGGNLCPMASLGCKKACLFTAGRGRFQMVRDARIKKTLYFFSNRQAFLNDLRESIAFIERKAFRMGLKPCIRLNGTSDFPWETTGIMQAFPNVQFYDYTAIPKRALAYVNGDMPINYHLTFSRKESNNEIAMNVLKQGVSVAIVFDAVPSTYKGHTVINGDMHDLRFLDADNVIVGLKAKGKAKKDESGFVVKTKI